MIVAPADAADGPAPSSFTFSCPSRGWIASQNTLYPLDTPELNDPATGGPTKRRCRLRGILKTSSSYISASEFARAQSTSDINGPKDDISLDVALGSKPTGILANASNQLYIAKFSFGGDSAPVAKDANEPSSASSFSYTDQQESRDIGDSTANVRLDLSSPGDVAAHSADHTEEQPSRLMALPRELRDQVYDELDHDVVLEVPFGVATSVKSGPLAPLLRVSKEFSAEYQARIWKMAVLNVTDKRRAESQIGQIAASIPPALMNHIQHISLCIQGRNSIYDTTSEKVRLHVKFLQAMTLRILQFQVTMDFPNMQERVYYPADLGAALDIVRASSCGRRMRSAQPSLGRGLSPFEELVDHEQIEGIEVRCFPKVSRNAEEPPVVPTIYGTWTKSQGWKSGKLEEVVVEEQTEEAERDESADPSE